LSIPGLTLFLLCFNVFTLFLDFFSDHCSMIRNTCEGGGPLHSQLLMWSESTHKFVSCSAIQFHFVLRFSLPSTDTFAQNGYKNMLVIYFVSLSLFHPFTVWPHVTTQEPLNIFSFKLILGSFNEICRCILFFVKTRQQQLKDMHVFLHSSRRKISKKIY
jgi:hypothetical protein